MLRNSRLFIILLASFCLLSVTAETATLQDDEPGNYLGVILTADTQEQINREQLNRLTSIGIRVIEVEGLLSAETTDRIAESGLNLMVRQERPYNTPSMISIRDSLYLEYDLALVREYSNRLQDQFYAFAPFVYPDDRSDRGRQQLQLYSHQLIQRIDSPPLLYYSSTERNRTTVAGYAFHSLLFNENLADWQTPVVYLQLNDSESDGFNRLYQVLEHSLELEQSLVLLPGSWLMRQLDRYEWTEDVITAYTEEGVLLNIHTKDRVSEVFPINGEVLLLIILLFTYLIHYRLSSVYRESVFRYFGSRRYFIEYILEYRMRSVIPGLILFVQHIFIAATVLYILLNSLLSQTAMDAFYYHIPLANLFGTSGPALFVTLLVASALLQTIDLFWLQLFSGHYKTSQTIALYSWPLQISFPLLVLIVLFFQTGSYSWILITSGLFIAVWLGTFFLTAIEIIRLAERFRLFLAFMLIGLPVTLLLFAAALLLYHPSINDVIQLLIGL